MTGTAREAGCVVQGAFTLHSKVRWLHKPRNLAKSGTVE
jgi:hypothetical protein